MRKFLLHLVNKQQIAPNNVETPHKFMHLFVIYTYIWSLSIMNYCHPYVTLYLDRGFRGFHECMNAWIQWNIALRCSALRNVYSEFDSFPESSLEYRVPFGSSTVLALLREAAKSLRNSMLFFFASYFMIRSSFLKIKLALFCL